MDSGSLGQEREAPGCGGATGPAEKSGCPSESDPEAGSDPGEQPPSVLRPLLACALTFSNPRATSLIPADPLGGPLVPAAQVIRNEWLVRMTGRFASLPWPAILVGDRADLAGTSAPSRTPLPASVSPEPGLAPRNGAPKRRTGPSRAWFPRFRARSWSQSPFPGGSCPERAPRTAGPTR